MNDLQQKELELLEVFVDLCEKLDLPYYLVCGSALGAVKYGGFIPWDDDVDVGLLRSDYETFLDRVPALLPDGFFLQTWKSDPNYPQVFAKLRNSNTTYIEKSASSLDINHGIYIDIFPLDWYPSGKREQRRLEKQKLWYKRFLDCNFTYESGFGRKIACSAFRFLGLNKKNAAVMTRYERVVAQYTADSSTILCNHGNWQGKREYAPEEQYGKGTAAEFEGLRVRIPERYDEYLTQKYGDWRMDLPKEQQVGHHYCAVCDTQRPYTAYIDSAANGRIKVKLPK